MLLVLLRNAWSTYYTRIGRPGEVHDRESYRKAVKDRVWAREAWLDATWASVSGRKLIKILNGVPDELIWVDDTTLEVAAKSSGVKPPDVDHIREVLHERHITMVLACGQQSWKAIDKVWRGSVIKIPHPACRVISNYACKGYNSIIHVMLARFAARCCLTRVAMDTYGELVYPLERDEEPFDGGSWIRESFDEQAAGIAGGSTGGDQGVLSSKQSRVRVRASRSRSVQGRSALVHRSSDQRQDAAEGA